MHPQIFDTRMELFESSSSMSSGTGTTSGLKKPQPVSRLQLMQAQFQRKLLLEKEERMMQLYPSETSSSVGEPAQRTRGGAVRQFFAQRRAQPAIKDPLSISNGLISLQSSMNGGASGFPTGTFSRSTTMSNNGGGGGGGGGNINNNSNKVSKHGSPIGWDKSYPLTPLDRDGSSSSSGYDSFNSTFSTTSPYKNNANANNKNSYGKMAPGETNMTNNSTRRGPAVPRRNLAPPAAAARRAPSLDRRPRNDLNGVMRRSNSQVLVNGRQFDEDDGFVPFSRTRKSPPSKFDAPRISPAARKSRAPNQSPSTIISPTLPNNLTYKVPSPPGGRVQQHNLDDNSNPKGRRPVVPAIGHDHRETTQAPLTINKKSPPRAAQAGRPSSVDPNLVQCHLCGRNFAPDRIEKHETICEKSNTKKRKVFDPSKMRIKGTDLENFQRQSSKLGRGKAAVPPEPKKSDWRQKRNNFIETLRQAKMVQRHVAAGGRASDLPPPPPMDTSEYILCPHCGRKFAEGAAERHIPKCMNIKSNKNGQVRR